MTIARAVAALAAMLAGTLVFLSGPGDTAAPPPAPPVIRMPPSISWSPERPGEGRLFVVRLVESVHTPVSAASGSLGGEMLHFRRVAGDTLESLAGIPVGAVDSVAFTVRVSYEAGHSEELLRAVPVTAATYEHERLTVAPRFGAPPDSADAARLEGERAKARAVAAEAHASPRLWGDSVVLPRASPVTSGFGNGREFNGQISSRHLGLDLRGAPGDTVVAAARGVVALVDDFLLAGRIVYLNHGAGLLSAYFHLSEQLVAVGDTVEPGAPVGRVGATGRVTGPHLHWVVRYGRTSLDPRSLLDVIGS